MNWKGMVEVMEQKMAWLDLFQVLFFSSTTSTISSYGSSDTLFYNFYNGIFITIKSLYKKLLKRVY